MPKGHPFATVEESVAARRASWASYRARNLEKMRDKDRRVKKASRARDPEKHAAYMRAWSQTDKGREASRISKAKGRLKYRLKYIVRCIRYQAPKRGLSFDREFMETLAETRPEICECCGRPIDYESQSRKRGRTPSFDRLDSSKGYDRGNVRIICWRCNNVKRDSTIEELETVLAYMRLNLRG